jgi:hypothetical protein
MKNMKQNSNSIPLSAIERANKALRIAREVGTFSEDEADDISPEFLERCRKAAERSYYLANRSRAHLLKKSGVSLHEALIHARYAFASVVNGGDAPIPIGYGRKEDSACRFDECDYILKQFEKEYDDKQFAELLEIQAIIREVYNERS